MLSEEDFIEINKLKVAPGTKVDLIITQPITKEKG